MKEYKYSNGEQCGLYLTCCQVVGINLCMIVFVAFIWTGASLSCSQKSGFCISINQLTVYLSRVVSTGAILHAATVRGQRFLSSWSIHTNFGPTWPPVQWVVRTFSHWCRGQGMKLTTGLRLIQRLRMHGAVPLLYYMPSWHA